MLSSLPDAKLLAGGQSLGPMLNFRYLMPENLIDLNRVTELQGLTRLPDGALRIGAMTRQYQLEQDAALHEQVPIFREALRWVGHYATRNRGTIGGSLSHLDPAAELPGICALLDAELGIQSTRGRRVVSIHDWPVGFMQANIEEDELLTDIAIRPWTQPHGFAFIEMSRRHGDFAIAGVACLLAVDGQSRIERAAISVIGVSNGASRLRQAEKDLLGSPLTDDLARAAAHDIDQLEAPADAHHSGDFRKRTAKTLFSRAVQHAYQDAIKRRSAQ
ncbi:MAG: hypothetical protein RLZZ344_451 [Pseudomonadota bacterium]